LYDLDTIINLLYLLFQESVKQVLQPLTYVKLYVGEYSEKSFYPFKAQWLPCVPYFPPALRTPYY
jgi:hypothetical protein